MNSCPSKVSVIVPVYKGMDVIEKCLSALEVQTYISEDYEIIVIDNGENPGIEGLVAQFGQARLLREKKPGSYAARNLGIINSCGDIVAFTDADCVPNNDWIQNGVKSLLLHKKQGAIGGDVRIFTMNPRPTSVELYEQTMSLNQYKYIRYHKFAVTANLYTFRSVIDVVGMFDEKLKSGGDYEWCQRLRNAGYEVVYAKDVVVLHPARATLKQLYLKVTRVVGGVYSYKKNEKSNKKSAVIEDYRYYLDLMTRKFHVLKRIYQSEEYGGICNTVRIIYIAGLVKLIQKVERIRLMFGGGPKRT